MVAINYAVSPDQGPPVVLLHGLGFAWRTFSPLLPALAAGRQVFAPDLRGHGRSDRCPGAYRFEHFVDDAVAFVEEIVDEPAVLLGHSLGGAVALAAAARLGGGARALVIEDTFLFKDSQAEIMRQGIIPALQAGVQRLARAGGEVADIARALADIESPSPGACVRLGHLPGNDADFFAVWAECVSMLDPETLDVILIEEHSASYDPESYARALDCPVLLMQADPACGGTLPDRDVERALTLLPRATHIRLDGVGHMAHIQRPDTVLPPLLAFLESL
jgi:pimeloyl-ACP methyl ester carboxylesterase